MLPRWVVDNGHAWLEVPESKLLLAGIAGKVSSYSYIDTRSRNIYLEEDCDAPLYLQATATTARDYDELVIDGMAWVRNLPRVNA